MMRCHGSRQRDSDRRGRSVTGALVIGSSALLAACAGRDSGALDEARAAVERARSDQTVAAYAPDKLQEAQGALRQTEVAFNSHAPQAELDHLAYLAEQRAAIAQATAEENAAQAEIEELGKEHDQLLLDSRDREIAALESELRLARPIAGWSSPWATSCSTSTGRSSPRAGTSRSRGSPTRCSRCRTATC